MAAFNFIVTEVMCPNCERTSAVQFQTHIAAADLDGDDKGRFAGRLYSMGEKMAWFDLGHEEFPLWKTWGEPLDGTVYEYCHGTCPACGIDLYACIEFQDLRPTKVTEVGVADHWPHDPDQPDAQCPVVRSADFVLSGPTKNEEPVMTATLVWGKSFQIDEHGEVAGVEGGCDFLSWASVEGMKDLAFEHGVGMELWPVYPECEVESQAPIAEAQALAPMLRDALEAVPDEVIERDRWLSFVLRLLRQDQAFFIML